MMNKIQQSFPLQAAQNYVSILDICLLKSPF